MILGFWLICEGSLKINVLLVCDPLRGGALTHKHFQIVVKSNFNSLHVLNKKIKMTLEWDQTLPTGHIVSYKKLRDEGLHTFLGMVGDYMKDYGKDHFEFVHHNVSTHDMNEGKMNYAKFGKGDHFKIKSYVS